MSWPGANAGPPGLYNYNNNATGKFSTARDSLQIELAPAELHNHEHSSVAFAGPLNYKYQVHTLMVTQLLIRVEMPHGAESRQISKWALASRRP